MAYNTPESVADYLSRFQMQVTERTKGTFSPMHVKYSLALKMGSSSFETTFQSNPNVHGEPTVTQVFGALASDAMLAHHDGRVSVEMRQLTDEGERLWGQLDYEDLPPWESTMSLAMRSSSSTTSITARNSAPPPVTWSSPSDALLRNTRKRK